MVKHLHVMPFRWLRIVDSDRDTCLLKFEYQPLDWLEAGDLSYIDCADKDDKLEGMLPKKKHKKMESVMIACGKVQGKKESNDTTTECGKKMIWRYMKKLGLTMMTSEPFVLMWNLTISWVLTDYSNFIIIYYFLFFIFIIYFTHHFNWITIKMNISYIYTNID